MNLPKYIDLFEAPQNSKKHAAQLNYQRVNDLLSEFEAVEIGEILAAGFIYEIYGIELDLEDAETMELFPHLIDRACRTQYRQLLTDFDVNGKTYADKCEKNRNNAYIRWHGKGGKTEAPAPAKTEAPAEAETDSKAPEMSAADDAVIRSRRKPDMTEKELREMIKSVKALYPTFDDFRQAIINELNAGNITVKDKFYLIEYGKEAYKQQ